jgi:hypothetical protein
VTEAGGAAGVGASAAGAPPSDRDGGGEEGRPRRGIRGRVLIPAIVGGLAVIGVVVGVVVLASGGGGTNTVTTEVDSGALVGPGGEELLLPASIPEWDLTEVEGEGVLGIDPGPDVDQSAAQAMRGSDVAQVWGLAPSGDGETSEILTQLRSSIGGEKLDTIDLPSGQSADVALSGGAYVATFESSGRALVALAGTRQDAIEVASALGAAT